MGLITWAIIALVISFIAAGFGFTGISAGAATVAKVLFGLFLIIAIGLFLMVALGIGVAVAA